MIPVMRPQLPKFSQVEPYLKLMDSNRIYSNFGPLNRELEERLAVLLSVHANQVVTTSSATLGLQGCVALLPPQMWVVPSFTFAAAPSAVLGANKELVLCDVSPTTWLLDLQTTAPDPSIGLLPVLPFGAPLNKDDWNEWDCVVIDAAASLGNFPDLSNLSEGWACVFSMHATKALPAGEGGIVVFGSSHLASEFRKWSNFGFGPHRKNEGKGTNAKMSEIHAAYGLATLDEWGKVASEWEKSHAFANSLTAEFGLKSFNFQNTKNPYWIVEFSTKEKALLAEAVLLSQGVGTRRWWPEPMHEVTVFKDSELIGTGHHSRHLSETTIGLPMFRGITDRDVAAIRSALEETWNLLDLTE